MPTRTKSILFISVMVHAPHMDHSFNHSSLGHTLRAPPSELLCMPNRTKTILIAATCSIIQKVRDTSLSTPSPPYHRLQCSARCQMARRSAPAATMAQRSKANAVPAQGQHSSAPVPHQHCVPGDDALAEACRIGKGCPNPNAT
jgi:hypothetical protein